MPTLDPLRRNEIKKDYKIRTRGERKARVIEYLKAHPCIDCGETDPIVLEFDHLGDKVANIANMVNDCKPWLDIEKEIAKCEVVCANCHRRRTARRSGWWKQLSGIV